MMHRRSLEAPTSVLAAEMDLELLLVLEVFDRREGVQAVFTGLRAPVAQPPAFRAFTAFGLQ